MIWPLITSTIREYFRKSVIIVCLLFAVGLILFSWFVAPFTLGEASKIVRDFGLAAAALTGIVMTIFLGSRLLYRDIKRRAAYTLLTRPVTVEAIVIGKFCGIAVILFFIECLLHLILQFTLLFIEGAFSPVLLTALPFSLLEMYVILGLLFVFSSFSSSIMGTATGIVGYVVGHSAFDIRAFTIQPHPGVSGILACIVYFVIPNLEYFNIRLECVHGIPLGRARLIFSLCYGILYVTALVMASVLLFRKRNYM